MFYREVITLKVKVKNQEVIIPNNDDLANAALDEKLAEQEILRQSLEEKKKQAEEYYNQLLRLKAEFENYRKRVEKEKEKMYAYGKETILMKLVSLLDTLEQAEKNLTTENEKLKTENIIKGLSLITSDFRNFLKSEGLKVIESVGKKFNPHFHEVVEQEETEENEEGIILEELQKGYIFNGQVIRPAKVKIARELQNTPNESADIPE
ncbi:MAG TPA: nucleotide exchange factor GrpE [Elusimicrobia bacterium]|nr:nucleotide exchange factor GrpE [Elusimicrobiota bacterium]